MKMVGWLSCQIRWTNWTQNLISFCTQKEILHKVHILHDHHHQCGDDDGEDGDDISGPQLLDLSACEEISISKTLTAEQKYTALIDNCYKLIQVEPINHVVAKFCFSHARFYQLRKNDYTLGYSKEYLIKEIFDPEYERLKSENGL